MARTPPEIVAHAEHKTHALAAFIAQELEHWGFSVSLAYDDDPGYFYVSTVPGGPTFSVEMWES